MVIYGICENNKIIEASVHTKGNFYMPLIFNKKSEAINFINAKGNVPWRGVYLNCSIKKFNINKS